MSATPIFGSVINVHAHGATVRLEDGRLATMSFADVEAHRASLLRSIAAQKLLPFIVTLERRPRVTLASGEVPDPVVSVPSAEPIELTNEVFETQLADYLRETEERFPAAANPPFERHLVRKRRKPAS